MNLYRDKSIFGDKTVDRIKEWLKDNTKICKIIFEKNIYRFLRKMITKRKIKNINRILDKKKELSSLD